MNTKQILEEMSKGAVLCMEYSPEGKVYWLNPKRAIVRADQAEKIISLPGIESGNDGIFHDSTSQTWKMSQRGVVHGKSRSTVSANRKRARSRS